MAGVIGSAVAAGLLLNLLGVKDMDKISFNLTCTGIMIKRLKI